MARVKVLQIKKHVPATWEEAMQNYLWFKQAEGLREATINGHRDVIKLFFKRHPDAYGDPQKLKSSVYAFMGENIKPATYNIRRNYLKQFFGWGIREEIFVENPLEALKKRKDEGRVVNLDAKVLSKLLTLPDQKTFAGLRDYGLIMLTLDTGIRPNEAFSLQVEDINWRALEVYVRSDVAKTKISRTLPISPVTAQAIKSLTQARHPMWGEGIPIFCSTEGTKLTRHTWNDRLEKYGKKLGVKIRPYDLRHAFALQFLRNGGHALALQRTLGHTNLTMTKRYVALTQEDLRQQHTLASPLNVLLPQKHRVRKVRE